VLLPSAPSPKKQEVDLYLASKERLVIDDVWPPLCRNGRLYGIERYAGNRSMRRKIQVCGILDRIPFIFPVNRLLSDHMFLVHLCGLPH
jgi:hypothetical protein